MSRIVAGLQRSGLLKRIATDDKRSFRLQATAKGTRILQEGRRRRVEALAHALQTLSSEELQQAAQVAEFMRDLVRKL
jgi:DNA-binding MarR family transcriptional regulator